VTKVDAISGEPVVTDGTAVTQVSEFSRGTRRSRRSNAPATLAWVVTAVAVVGHHGAVGLTAGAGWCSSPEIVYSWSRPRCL